MGQETAQTLIEGAYSYAAAVVKLTSYEVDPHSALTSLPCLMLSGYALELAGKAFLRNCGNHTKTGHDLLKLYSLAKAHGIPMTPRIEEGIQSLAPWHGDHSFRYLPAGFRQSVPNLESWPLILQAHVEKVTVAMAGARANVGAWLYQSPE